MLDRSVVLESARTRAEATAKILEQHARAALRAGDASVQAVSAYIARHDLADPAVRREIGGQIRTAVDNNPQISTLWVLDADGRIVTESTSTLVPSTRSFSDRIYFRQAAAGGGRVFIGPTGQGTATGKPRFTLSRGVFDAAGVFKGAVISGILSEQFSAVYREAGLPDGSQLSLASPTVGLLAAYPGPEPSDAREIAAERKLPEYSVVVRVAAPEDAVLSDWRERWTGAAAVLALAIAAFGGISVLGRRASLREADARSRLADANGELSAANARLAQVNGDLERRVRDRTAALEVSQDALKRSERRLNAVLDNTTMAIFMMDERQHCAYANAAAETLTGFRFEDMVGRPLHEVIHHTRPDGSQFPLEDCPIDRAFPENSQEQGETDFIHRDGHFYPVAYTASPIRNEEAKAVGTIIEIRDITGERAARAALERSEERLRLATAGAGVGTFEADLVRGVGEWSAEAAAQMGLGRSQFTVDDWLDGVHPDDRDLAHKAWRDAMEGRADYQVRFRVSPGPAGTVRWLLARGMIDRDATGRPKRAAGMMLDITRQVEAEQALAASFAELQALYDTAPVGLCMLDTERRFVRVNRKLAEINGISVDGHSGRTVAELVPTIDASVRDVLGRVIAEKTSVLDFEVVGETRAQPGSTRHFNESFVPVLGEDGAVIGINIVVEETTERRRAEIQRETLINELNHRVKNTLATVQSVVRQTLGASSIAADVQAALDARLGAMARSHDLLTTAHWADVECRDVVDAAVEPFRTRGIADRFAISGPAVMLPPSAALTLGMAVHELATNAAKYGALSGPDGRVRVVWQIDGGRLRIDWAETGGPAVSPPVRKGFGTRLLERVVASDLDGEVRLAYRPEGLACRIDAPIPGPRPATV